MTGYDRCASEAAAIEHVIATGKAKTKAEARRFLLLNIPREAVYQKKILDYLKKEYPQAFVFKAAAGPYSRGGVPDIIAVIDGQFYGFEVKRPYYGKLSPLQKASIKRINDAGGVAAVVTFPEDVAKLIRGRE